MPAMGAFTGGLNVLDEAFAAVLPRPLAWVMVTFLVNFGILKAMGLRTVSEQDEADGPDDSEHAAAA